MKIDEVTPVLDVHPPHETPHGWRDFFIHLFTITIGLLIALSLEGIVEWQHHRHLVHDAEASLHKEIQNNANIIQTTLDELDKEQANLKHDIAVLQMLVKTHKAPANESLYVDFRIHTFEGVSWKTAQSTGALSYMPYNRAQEYADIYATQDELATSEQQTSRDAILSLGPLNNATGDQFNPTPAQTDALMDRMETLQGQLILVDNFMQSLSRQYKEFLAAHPGDR